MTLNTDLSSAAPSAAVSLDHIEAIVRRSGTSFYWAMRFLPKEKRRAMFAVYAFCREVDDIADEPGLIDRKRQALQEWRDEIDRLYGGEATRPVSRALQAPVERFGLRREDFIAVIDGMAMDASPHIRIADMAELHLYCDRVACAVGRLSVRIFGVPEPKGDRLAAALGEALQLTNILRDIKEDAARDRLYLPGDLLRARGIDGSGNIDAVLRHPAVIDVCEQLSTLVLQRFEEAASVAAACDRKRVRPAVVMMQVYRRTFDRLVGRGWRRWAEPVEVSRAEKLWVALRYGMV
jgi:presqualene diphosphate synthase